MKFYPRLNIFKNPKGTNTFDGQRAYSYTWYCYALKLTDGRWVMPSDSYSSTTNKHQSDWRSLVGYETDVIHVTAPKGLTKIEEMKEGIACKQEKLKEEIAKKGSKKAKNEARQVAILALDKEYETVSLIEETLNNSSNKKAA